MRCASDIREETIVIINVSVRSRPPSARKAGTRPGIVGLWLAVLVPLLAPLLIIPFIWQRWVDWRSLGLLAGMYVACVLGITVGYHRMLTHRSFQAHPALKFVLLALGAMSAMGPALQWAITHIQHHAHSDDAGDPHSPWEWVEDVRRIRTTGLRPFLRAHFLWVIYGAPIGADGHGQWLIRDRMVRAMSAWPVVVFWIGLGFIIPWLLGGWQGLVWGGFIRLGLTHHVTWSINSVCHVYGRRMFRTPDCSRNNWLFGLLGLGEGWHNNHHAFPRSAFHGLRWWQIDASGYVIRGLELLGLARDVWRVPREKLAARLAHGERGPTARPPSVDPEPA